MVNQHLRQRQIDAFKTQDVQRGQFDVTFQFGEQQLHAHKLILSTASEIFDAMFKDCWTNKDRPIPITTYSFYDFKEFLTFIYVSKCNIDEENIVSMVDIAVSYQVAELMKVCDERLSKSHIDIDNFLQMYKLSSMYSTLPLFKSAITSFMVKSITPILKSRELLNTREKLFKEISNFGEVQGQYEEVFEATYKWAENQAAIKQNAAETFNKNEMVREELAKVLPKICFEKMNYDYIIRCLIPRALIFSAEELQELSNILCGKTRPCVNVTISDFDDKTLKGKVYGNPSFLKSLYGQITSLKKKESKSLPIFGLWDTNIVRPDEISHLKVNDMVDYYLIILEVGKRLAIIQTTNLHDSHYLLAEMKTNDGFTLVGNEFCLKIEASLDF